MGAPENESARQSMSFDYDTLPAGYYDRIHQRRSGAQSRWHHQKFARFARAMAAGGRHLDIGCGPGTFIGTLPSEECESTGIDIAAAQIAYAEAHHGGPKRRFQVVAAGPLPFEADAFDVVSMIELIEHLPHERNMELLGEALRVIRPGGRILVSTPNYRSLWPWIEKLAARFGAMDYGEQHITRYHRHSLANLMAESGAIDVTVEGYMLMAPFTAALSWRLADLVERLEPAALVNHFGLLLFAWGSKKNGA